jgi:hypothetical protein
LDAAEAADYRGAVKPVLVEAISQVIQDPRPMINLAEAPTALFMIDGLLSRKHYYQVDGQYQRRQKVINDMNAYFEAHRLPLKGVLEGSRAIGIGIKDKSDALKDALRNFGYACEDAVVLADLSMQEESMAGMIYDRQIGLINVGEPIEKDFENPVVQYKAMYGLRGALLWMTVLTELNAPFVPKGHMVKMYHLIRIYEQLLENPTTYSKWMSRNLRILKNDLQGIPRALFVIYDEDFGLNEFFLTHGFVPILPNGAPNPHQSPGAATEPQRTLGSPRQIYDSFLRITKPFI